MTLSEKDRFQTAGRQAKRLADQKEREDVPDG